MLSKLEFTLLVAMLKSTVKVPGEGLLVVVVVAVAVDELDDCENDPAFIERREGLDKYGFIMSETKAELLPSERLA